MPSLGPKKLRWTNHTILYGTINEYFITQREASTYCLPKSSVQEGIRELRRYYKLNILNAEMY